MKFSVTVIFISFIGYSTAVNLRLFKRPNACTGTGVICANIPAGTCCADIGTLYGSSQADNGGAGNVAVFYSKQGDLYCGVQLSPPKPIPICFISNLDSSVGGIAWYTRAARKRSSGKMESCKTHVQGDKMYSDGVNTYVISKEKFANVNATEPTSETELLKFYKTHADTVLDDKQDISVEKVAVKNAAKSE